MVRVDVVDPSGAERAGDHHDVEGDAPRPAAHDEDVRSRRLGEKRGDRSPGVGQVVARARHRRRRDALRQRHEHRIGERHANEVGECAAPVATDRLHAVCGTGARRPARAGESACAPVAPPAGDLERNHDAIAAPEAADGVARLDDFRDELVSERKRPAERNAPVDDGVIQVARRHDERADERVVGRLDARIGHFLPPHDAGLDERELSHRRTVARAASWCKLRRADRCSRRLRRAAQRADELRLDDVAQDVLADAEPAVKRAAHLDHPPRRAHGTGGHAGGASVRGCAMNRPGRSLLAVDGGLPPIFAGASAHQGRSVPSVTRTAIRPCVGSSSV